jgi:hypothetical protein
MGGDAMGISAEDVLSFFDMATFATFVGFFSLGIRCGALMLA